MRARPLEPARTRRATGRPQRSWNCRQVQRASVLASRIELFFECLNLGTRCSICTHTTHHTHSLTNTTHTPYLTRNYSLYTHTLAECRVTGTSSHCGPKRVRLHLKKNWENPSNVRCGGSSPRRLPPTTGSLPLGQRPVRRPPPTSCV